MQRDFWLERWQNGETGFHQEQLNPYLGYFYGEKGVPLEKRKTLKVFVPLCGKSVDMLWLAQNGYQVLGIECSEIAVKDFFETHDLEFRIVEGKRFKRYISDAREGHARVEILQGDFFDLVLRDLEAVTDIYDRASMIALPEIMRLDYFKKMVELQDEGMRTLLVTLTYPQEEMSGPPFSVSENELNDLYSEKFKIDKLLGKDILADEPRFQQRGLTALYEIAFKLTRK
ncbi:MAG: thiopurine S-methyltransferase [Gammaproteobacteria bacterium]|nr:thiopurine S-methyltransferase [Gammaproteobacteria bacterium]MCK5262256.1 thiopurine S-methyltransferase [Gammaproteobacteria bacterium]